MLPMPLRLLFALCYSYAAAVHVQNMTGQSGYHWGTAPTHWRVLDVLYVACDGAVVATMLFAPDIGSWVLGACALSQMLLYTALRGWVMGDDDQLFGDDDAMHSYLNALVAFHAVTLAVIALYEIREPKAAL